MAEHRGPGRLHAYLAAYSGTEEPLMSLLPARPYIELSSNVRMLVEGCTGIREYERECICLTAGRWLLRITGSGLVISSMKEQCAVITGVIAAVEYLSAEGQP